MDKQILKVKKDVKENKKKKAMHDVSSFLKMYNKFDKKLEKCLEMEKSKKK